MKIKETLQRDPASHPLVNQGQARISDSRNERTQSELRGELVTFVCEGQYADGVQELCRRPARCIRQTRYRDRGHRAPVPFSLAQSPVSWHR